MTERPTPPSVLYGPVPSRRLGFSLGVDLLPFKTCSMDCVYCQLGASAATTVGRRDFVSVRTVLAQIRRALASGARIDAVTFSGSGEPTLHASIGAIIRGIKRMTAIPVVVLTNSFALARPDVRRALRPADIVVPSLDAATDAVFRRVNRPHAGLTAAGVIAGLAAFRREFRGQIWLEIMLVLGLNDGPRHLAKLKAAVDLIRPDRVQLNTVVRPPAERRARPLGRDDLERIREFFGGNTEIIADFKTPLAPSARAAGDAAAEILAVAGRRPVTLADLALSLSRPAAEIAPIVDRFVAAGKLRAVRHNDTVYYEAP